MVHAHMWESEEGSCASQTLISSHLRFKHVFVMGNSHFARLVTTVYYSLQVLVPSASSSSNLLSWIICFFFYVKKFGCADTRGLRNSVPCGNCSSQYNSSRSLNHYQTIQPVQCNITPVTNSAVLAAASLSSPARSRHASAIMVPEAQEAEEEEEAAAEPVQRSRSRC